MAKFAKRLSFSFLLAITSISMFKSLFADKKPPANASRDLSLVVLVDTSPHQAKVIEFERDVLNSLASAFAGSETNALLIRYGKQVQAEQQWFPVRDLKSASVRLILDEESPTDQRTLLNDALEAALSNLEKVNADGSKVLVVIGEGNDSGSVAKYKAIKKRAVHAEVQCFVLLVASHNLMGGRLRQYGFDLYDLASATNAKAYDIEQSRKNVDKAIRDMQKRIQ